MDEIDDVFAHAPANQSPALESLDWYASDRALRDAVRHSGAEWSDGALSEFGAALGKPETLELGRLANVHPPTLHAFDRQGRRVDRVEFHPAYHALMALGMQAGLHGRPWDEARPGAHVARAAGVILFGQVEAGVQCPLTMTYAARPVLDAHRAALGDAAPLWLERLADERYDSRFAPIEQKTSATIGMGMTEKQGGSDVRSNLTRATPLGARNAGARYRIDGHKWFMSAPMSDAFLVLAQAPGGLSCFFVPRWIDGRINAIRLQRLKDKLGNRSNASSEAEFHGAIGLLVGDEGRGVPTIIEMVNVTRLDCGLGSAALMRNALAHALHHARHRRAFGRRLLDQALMKNVLADLALESEAATALMLRLARTFDAPDDPHEASLKRLFVPSAKYWICKRLAPFAQEAMEVLGGNGYVEESPLPRLYREAPLNSIWEGSGNVISLAVLRALGTAGTVEALWAEIDGVRGADGRLDAAGEALRRSLAAMVSATDDAEASARRTAERLCVLLQAALLLRQAPAYIAAAFCASRLVDGARGGAFGTLPSGHALDAIVDRAMPVEC